MNKLKSGISLIVLGNLLYIAYIIFCENETTSFGEFTSGLLLGLSIGVNLIGTILTILYISETSKKENKK